MDVFEFVFGIILITVVGGVWTTHMRTKARRVGKEGGADSLQMREELTRLRDRLAVLERITVEKENSLEREIEQLRNR
ncbi:MAG TPA: hypothetical protein VGB59_09215 [Allosphingosinicella sp.]|jgi:hypothetical protein